METRAELVYRSRAFAVIGTSLISFVALIATAILALSLALPAWLAALVVTVVVFAAAGVAALVGRRQVQEAAPPVPRETIDSVERDVAEVKEASHHGRHAV